MPTRRSTSKTLDAALLDEARALGANISRAADTGLQAAVKHAQREAWQRENAEAIASYKHLHRNLWPASGQVSTVLTRVRPI